MSAYEERARERARAFAQGGHALILGIESSCDETAFSVVRDGREELGSSLYSQIASHRPFGGVVPEIASRMHVSALDALLDEALKNAGVSLRDIDAVAVTYGPGLVGALLTGVSYAKALAYAADKPLVPVNHIEGHVSANYVVHPDMEPPFVCLVASGGHSHIVYVSEYGKYRLLGRTLDDAAGEAFDKVARVLGLPYPGGPALDALAEGGDPARYRFPKPEVGDGCDFSFSGLKTAAINALHRARQAGEEIDEKDFAASFRECVAQALARRAVKGALLSGADALAAAGGVAANSRLRSCLAEEAERHGMRLYLPPVKLCTDNAVMVASAGYFALMRGAAAPLSLNARPSIDMFGEERA